ncbi:MAG: HEAT repeat domain-containing protein [Promethearchaeota archaeon]
MSEEKESKLSKRDLQKYEKKLRSKKREHVLSALNELQEIQDKKTAKILEPFLEEIRESSDWEIKNKAIVILGTLGSKHSVNVLSQYLQDDNVMVRESAAYALGQIGDKRSVPGLISALSDSEYTVRENAANALSRIGDPRAIDSLIECSNSEVMEERLSVIPALSAFANKDERVLDSLIKALSDEVSQVRFPAIIAFNKIKSPKAIEPLIDNLESDDPLLQKVASDALVYNLGWGSVKEGKLTKFGEKRRELLKAQLEGAHGEKGKSMKESFQDSNDVITGFDDLSSLIADVLDLSAKKVNKINDLFSKLEKKYKIVEKSE